MSFFADNFASLFMGFTDMWLLFLFSRSQGALLREKGPGDWGAFLLCWLLYSAAQILANYESPLDYYLFVTAAMAAYVLLGRFFCGRDVKTAIYYAAIYYIISDCVLHLVIRMGCRACGMDPIVYGPLGLRFLWNCLALACKGLALYIIHLFMDRGSRISGSLPYMLFLCLLPLLPYLYIRNLTNWFPSINVLTAPPSLDLALVLNAGCGLILLLGNEKIRSNSRRSQERARAEAMLHGQSAEYAARMAAAEKVNKSYHNLKHILSGIDALSTEEAVHAYIRDAFSGIGDYALFCNAGNPVMDFFLSDTMGRCGEEGIRFVPYADGRDWGEVAPMDLAVLLGNALDNAVEGASTVENPEKRVIHANIRRSGGFLLMQVHNYYGHALRREGGRLRSTKGEAHGYGLDSIRSVAEKYGGAMDIDLQGDGFTLCVMIPWNRGA